MTSDTPLVSVLTPSFNQASWLPDNLRSVENQTYPAIEHVVMDGGSSDGSVEILQARSRDGLLWCSEPDRGQSHALNKAFGVSKGEIIGWLNSDDAFFGPNAVQQAVEAFRSRPAVDVLYGHALLVNGDGLIIQTLWVPPFSRRLLRLHDFIFQPAVFIRRRALTAGFVDETFDHAMDYELWLRLARKHRIQRLDLILAIDRHQPARKSYTLAHVGRTELELLHRMYGVRTSRIAVAARKLVKIGERLLGASLIASSCREPLVFEGRRDGAARLLRRQLTMRRAAMRAHWTNHRRLFGPVASGSCSAGEPPPDGSEWRPGRLDQVRALARRAVISTLGDRVEGRLHGVYHRVLRRAGRFGLPEDEATEAVLAAVAARSRTILDIGANVGRYAWFLERHASSRSVLFALEPHPVAARLLRSAVGASPRCTVLEVAAADRDEIAELLVPDGPFGTPLSALAWVRSQHGGEDRHVLRIATRRIDSLIQDGTISVADPVFMKIDVEGAEGRVLRGAAGLLSRHRPVIYFECQTPSLSRQDETPEGVWNELEHAGYRIFANRASRFVPVDRIQPEVANYLAVPDLDEADEDQPLDAAAIIAIIDRWATRGSEA